MSLSHLSSHCSYAKHSYIVGQFRLFLASTITSSTTPTTEGSVQNLIAIEKICAWSTDLKIRRKRTPILRVVARPNVHTACSSYGQQARTQGVPG